MNAWTAVYDEVRLGIETLGSPATVWFRGHADARWRLVPTLARCRPTSRARVRYATNRHREFAAIHHFVTEAGNLLTLPERLWSAAFAMQHHGLPTRLLDWSSTFGVALYFAMKTAKREAAIWILNPYRLNKVLLGRGELFSVDEFPGDYYDMFVKRSKPFSAPAAAFDPPRNHPRIFNQKGGFTVHKNLRTGLDRLAPSSIRKIVIPMAAQPGARAFLEMAGISEFSLFPDLDGLARDLHARLF